MTRRTLPWAKILRNLAEQYGWTWADISGMTLYQALVAAGAQCPEDITYKPKAK